MPLFQISSAESDCLDNKPLWMRPFDEILPGRWLTLNGQCRNAGFESTCKVRIFLSLVYFFLYNT